jgi:cytochrome c oxidase cbb3-type subunit II
MSDHEKSRWSDKIELSAVLTVLGIILLFSTAIIVTLVAPNYVDPTWTSPTTPYQVQMYEVEDPYLYLSSAATEGQTLQYVHHLKENFTLLAFKESGNIRIIAPPDLEKFITPVDDKILKLTSRLLLLRKPQGDSVATAEKLRLQKQKEWEEKNPDWKKQGLVNVYYEFLELYDPKLPELFSFSNSGGSSQNWVDKDFTLLDEKLQQPYHKDYGVVYVLNPVEFRISPTQFGSRKGWRYDSQGEPVKSLDALKEMKFYSRKELISLGEHIFAIEGCWYCHTDQTRTLIQDLVLNGSESYPAPPSSANEYIYQKITFPGTRRIGPDISRVGVKRASRDWHKSHFWSPKTASKGSIMPAFQHFFDDDPRGNAPGRIGIPNYQFEAIYQYLMTKGTRITPPTEAWWLGKDPIKTKEIIEGKRRLP